MTSERGIQFSGNLRSVAFSRPVRLGYAFSELPFSVIGSRRPRIAEISAFGYVVEIRTLHRVIFPNPEPLAFIQLVLRHALLEDFLLEISNTVFSDELPDDDPASVVSIVFFRISGYTVLTYVSFPIRLVRNEIDVPI